MLVENVKTTSACKFQVLQMEWVRKVRGLSHPEERSILISVVVLLARVLPRNPENCFLVIFPNQSGVAPAVNLIDQPLSKFPVAATD